MRAWSILGMAGAALTLATVLVCLWLARAEEPPRTLHWVSFLGSRKAPAGVRALFRIGLTVGAALYGAFAIASLLHADAPKLALASTTLVGAALGLATLASCPMDVHPRAHVIGAVAYFVLATLGATLAVVPPRTSNELVVVLGIAAGSVILVPLFAVSLAQTAGMSPQQLETYFTAETRSNRLVRCLQHPAVGITGTLLFMTAMTAFSASAA
jgi:hypothetical protein